MAMPVGYSASGGTGGSAGPADSHLETGGFNGLFGLDSSGWSVATSGSNTVGGTSGGGGAGASAKAGLLGNMSGTTLLIGAGALVLLAAVVLWRKR